MALIRGDETLRESTCQYLREVAKQTKKFEHELLKSVLVLFLNLPKFLLKESSILKCLQLPIRQVFVHSHLNLIEIGIGNFSSNYFQEIFRGNDFTNKHFAFLLIDSLSEWTNFLGHETLRPFFVSVIPYMKKILDEEKLDILEDSKRSKSSKSKKIDSKKIEVMQETEQEVIQRKILLFFGKLNR